MNKKLAVDKAAIYEFAGKVLFPVILFIYPLRHIAVGVEWWDTGYNYGNFVYMDRMDPMWVFGTYLGHALGNLFSRLPFGNYMMGLNVYTGLLVSLLALGGYLFFTRKVKIPAGIAFAGEMLAVSLCWCPTALLYNYLTYVLMGAGVICLYFALTDEKRRYFVAAGVFLGVNVFVRFPNLAQMALILAVWAYGRICKVKFSRVMAQTGWCILGYAAGAAACLGYLALRYGLDEYISAIIRLLEMPSEASDYTVSSMVINQLQNYLQNLLWLRYMALAAVIGIILYRILPGKLKWPKRIGFTGLLFVLFYYLMQNNMFNMKYSTKMSVFQWAVFFLTATILGGVWIIFNRRAAKEDKLLAGLGILVILITPLGSNNHLYSSINNLFLVAPFTLWLLVRFLRFRPEKLFLEPVRITVLSMLFMLAIQSLAFGWVYVFSESNGGENLHTKIENNGILKGMYTSPDRAEAISTISAFINENGLAGRELILYGQIPAMSYYLQMPSAISSWPDLRSYHYDVMEAELSVMETEIAAGERQLPAILLEADYGRYLEGDAVRLAEAGMEETVIARMESDRKFALLLEWADRYGYETVFRNDKFTLLLPQQGGSNSSAFDTAR